MDLKIWALLINVFLPKKNMMADFFGISPPPRPPQKRKNTILRCFNHRSINNVAGRFLSSIASQNGPMNGRVKTFDVVFITTKEWNMFVIYAVKPIWVISVKNIQRSLSVFWDNYSFNRQKMTVQKMCFLNKQIIAIYILNLRLLLISSGF